MGINPFFGTELTHSCAEVFEETNLDVEVKHIVAVVDRQLEGFHYVIIDYWVQLVDEERCFPIAQSDVAEAKWISLDDLGLYDVVVGLTEIIVSAYHAQAQMNLVGLHDVDLAGTDFILPTFIVT